MAVDPVCKMEVDETEPEQRVEYNGRTYFFCSPICLERFEQDPTKYARERHHAA